MLTLTNYNKNFCWMVFVARQLSSCCFLFSQFLRYNDYTHDPLSKCNCTPPYSAENAISARSDLNPKDGKYPFGALQHRRHGGTDCKVCFVFCLFVLISLSFPCCAYTNFTVKKASIFDYWTLSLLLCRIFFLCNLGHSIYIVGLTLYYKKNLFYLHNYAIRCSLYVYNVCHKTYYNYYYL